ncbi:MAG: hypothetical protein JWL60_1856 [Gemmatimonadetes bacterium]|nr:hypothetical protein [Gemmatimonadota bacterium]
MPTLRHCAGLLASADSPSGLAAVAAALGFTGPPDPLDADACARLGIPPGLSDVRVAAGTGALRALLVVAPPSRGLRELLSTLATALARSTAQVLWLLVAASGDETAVACWAGDRARPRLGVLLVNRRRIVASDADALSTLAASSDGDDLLVHTRWCEVLGREVLSRRFYRTLAQRVEALAASLVGVPRAEAAEMALLTVSRLLFLAFLQAKGWLNGERAFLSARFDECLARGGAFHGRVLLPLFFGTLNTPVRRRAPRARAFGAVPFLNGGLFARTAVERRYGRHRFSDEAFGALFSGLLDAYRFTAREDDAEWTEVAIDPEMLGRAFESLMAEGDRRTSGTFYTPQPLVAHLTDESLVVSLASGALHERAVRLALAGRPLDDPSRALLRERLDRFTVLDPACGSGAFLVHLLERLTALRQAAGDTRPVADIRRAVLARSIHGVDVNPTAVWLCELRLWLSVVIESEESRMGAVTPLPNLDCNVRVGDSLAGNSFSAAPALVGPSAALVRLRERYARAVGPRKAPLRRALARDERLRSLATVDHALATLAHERRERLLARRAPDLFGKVPRPTAAELEDARMLRARVAALRRERRRLVDGGALPFGFPSHFGHVHAQGGFSLVIGNPPWVRLHNIPVASRVALRERFSLFREPAWQPSFSRVAPPQGFGAQIDLAALFVERALSLAAPSGAIGFLLPAKLWRSLSGGSLRRLLSTKATVRRIEDWSEAPCSFDAAVYPSVLVAANGRGEAMPAGTGVRRRRFALEWQAPARSLGLDTDPASPWLLLPPDVRASFDALAAHGIPLGACGIGRATLGVKCGCNDAFTVQTHAADGDCIAVGHLGRTGRLEHALVRPLVRGEGLTPWTLAPSARAILWTHGPDGAPLATLPAGAARWLAPWKRQLAGRSDLHGSRAWWMLFRTEAADCSRPRVVWGDFGRVPVAALLPAGEPMVPLNSCYVLACDDLRDALALTALLNSGVAAAWLNAIAEPARGGWHRYLAWTVNMLPVPRDWPRARDILGPLAERAMLGAPPGGPELVAAVCRAYRIRLDAVQPLLAWGS